MVAIPSKSDEEKKGIRVRAIIEKVKPPITDGGIPLVIKVLCFYWPSKYEDVQETFAPIELGKTLVELNLFTNKGWINAKNLKIIESAKNSKEE